MDGEPTRRLRSRGLAAALAVCALAAVAAASPAAAKRPHPSPKGLWRTYPLEQSHGPRSAERQSERSSSAARHSRRARTTPTASPSPAASPGPRHSPAPGSAAQPRAALRSGASNRAGPGPIAVAGLVAVGVLLAAGGLALLWLRRRPAPALRAPLPAPRAADAPPAPLAHGLSVAETCWIVCWRAHGRGVFCAIARDFDGRQRVIGESPPFAATADEPLVLDGATSKALQSLASRLCQDGWEAAAPVGARGAVWHAREFRRKTLAADLRR
jgi:hypothetical protein